MFAIRNYVASNARALSRQRINTITLQVSRAVKAKLTVADLLPYSSSVSSTTTRRSLYSSLSHLPARTKCHSKQQQQQQQTQRYGPLDWYGCRRHSHHRHYLWQSQRHNSSSASECCSSSSSSSSSSAYGGSGDSVIAEAVTTRTISNATTTTATTTNTATNTAATIPPDHSFAICDSSFAPICHLQHGLETLQATTGAPWWVVIVGTTITLRTVVTLPLTVNQQRRLARAELLAPRLREWSEAIAHKVAGESRRAGLSHQDANTRAEREIRAKHKELLAENGLHWWKMAGPLFAQLPLWLSLSYALRGLTADASSATFVALQNGGGTAWFPDLVAADATWVLPVLLGASNLINLEVGALGQMPEGTRQRVITGALRTLSLALIPVAAQVPAALTLYWATSSAYGLGQSLALRRPRIRRALGIAPTPGETDQPFKAMVEAWSSRTTKFWIEVREKNF